MVQKWEKVGGPRNSPELWGLYQRGAPQPCQVQSQQVATASAVVATAHHVQLAVQHVSRMPCHISRKVAILENELLHTFLMHVTGYVGIWQETAVVLGRVVMGLYSAKRTQLRVSERSCSSPL